MKFSPGCACCGGGGVAFCYICSSVPTTNTLTLEYTQGTWSGGTWTSSGTYGTITLTLTWDAVNLRFVSPVTLHPSDSSVAGTYFFAYVQCFLDVSGYHPYVFLIRCTAGGSPLFQEENHIFTTTTCSPLYMSFARTLGIGWATAATWTP